MKFAYAVVAMYCAVCGMHFAKGGFPKSGQLAAAFSALSRTRSRAQSKRSTPLLALDLDDGVGGRGVIGKARLVGRLRG